ncbi:hypothetical protein EV294_102355 [Paenibacillus sp. BK033]|nr:hypothetical protein [Paenibacillus sp. BK720]TCM99068.1 hypothetical protein EV294_102355 [Paenibacillus sp. BK033]
MLIVIHHSRIKNITSCGLAYFNDQHAEVLIDFMECRKNGVLYLNRSDLFEGEDRSIHSSSCVGLRDAFDNPMYIELFTEPRTRFVYPYRSSFLKIIGNLRSRRAYAQFRKTNDSLTKHGWTTLDLG